MPPTYLVETKISIGSEKQKKEKKKISSRFLVQYEWYKYEYLPHGKKKMGEKIQKKRSLVFFFLFFFFFFCNERMRTMLFVQSTNAGCFIIRQEFSIYYLETINFSYCVATLSKNSLTHAALSVGEWTRYLLSTFLSKG